MIPRAFGDLEDLFRCRIRQVTWNRDRFPEDFMIQLTKQELENWRSHFAMSNPGAKMGLRRPPYAFTEQGIAMLSSVLRSQRAVQVNIAIMRAFVRLRELLATHKDLARKFDALETKYDRQFKVVFDAIRQLMEPDKPPKQQRIGFQHKKIMKQPELCAGCGGTLQTNIIITHTQPWGNDSLRFENVPGLVCGDCGHEWLSARTSQRIDQVIEQLPAPDHPQLL